MNTRVFSVRGPWAWLLLGLPLCGAGFAPVARAASATVSIQNFSFQPSSVTVEEGDTVTWVQRDAIGHTTRSDDGLWASELLSFGKTFTHTFLQAGTYAYHCAPHPFMTGSVVVQRRNVAPTVSITRPVDGATVGLTPPLELLATAEDDTQVVQVLFFAGAVQVGEASVAPFRSLAPGLGTGTFVLTAVAIDNTGLRGTSAPVAITLSASLSRPVLESFQRLPNGAFRVAVVGAVGATHTLEASEDLVRWVGVASSVPTSSPFTLTDESAGQFRFRFYRVRTP